MYKGQLLQSTRTMQVHIQAYTMVSYFAESEKTDKHLSLTVPLKVIGLHLKNPLLAHADCLHCTHNRSETS